MEGRVPLLPPPPTPPRVLGEKCVFIVKENHECPYRSHVARKGLN